MNWQTRTVCARVTTAGGKTLAQAGYSLIVPVAGRKKFHVIVSVSKALSFDQHISVTNRGFRSVIINADVSANNFRFAYNLIANVDIVVTTLESVSSFIQASHAKCV